MFWCSIMSKLVGAGLSPSSQSFLPTDIWICVPHLKQIHAWVYEVELENGRLVAHGLDLLIV